MVMGALTSKPYAFTARPWELKTYYSIDFLDTLNSKIRVDLRGIDVMRILPVVREQISDEWITDKIRFSYDAFKRQRLIKVLCKLKEGHYTLSLREVFSFLYDFSSKTDFKNVYFLVGKSCDLETLFAAKIWSRSWFLNTNFLQDFLDNSILNTAFKLKNNYFLTESFLNVHNSCLTIGLDLRYESPLLNLKIKQKINEKEDFNVFSFGALSKNTYSFFNLGSNIRNLISLIKGKLLTSNYLLNSSCLMLYGNNFLSFSFLLELLSYRLRASVKYISAYSSFLNMFATNFITSTNGLVTLSYDSLLFNLQADDFGPKNHFDNLLNIFMGSHGSSVSEHANYILPTAHFFEKKFNMLSLLGEHQQAQQTVLPKGDVRSEISYFYALDKFFYLSSLNLRFKLKFLIKTKYTKYYLHLFWWVKGLIKKPKLYYIKNRWKNLYNPSFGRLCTYTSLAVFQAYHITKIGVVRVGSVLCNKYINNYMFTHNYSRASHFLAVANLRYSYNNYNFKHD